MTTPTCFGILTPPAPATLIARARMCVRTAGVKKITVFIVMLVVLGRAGTANAQYLPRQTVCTNRQVIGEHTIQKYIFVAGWGWTNWKVHVNAQGSDRCSQGKLNIYVSVPHSAAHQKGGVITMAVWVRYRDTRTGAVGQWIQLKMVRGASVVASDQVYGPPNGQYVSMNDYTSLHQVFIQTSLWTRQDASGWVGIANGAMQCTFDLINYGSCRGT